MGKGSTEDEWNSRVPRLIGPDQSQDPCRGSIRLSGTVTTVRLESRASERVGGVGRKGREHRDRWTRVMVEGGRGRWGLPPVLSLSTSTVVDSLSLHLVLVRDYDSPNGGPRPSDPPAPGTSSEGRHRGSRGVVTRLGLTVSGSPPVGAERWVRGTGRVESGGGR